MAVHDINSWMRFPYGKKPLADSTLRNMKKHDLIQIIRDYEHNYAALYEAHEHGVAYAEQKFRVLDATKMLKRLTVRDIEGNARLKTSNEGIGWADPVTRLALLEDIIEEARR